MVAVAAAGQVKFGHSAKTPSKRAENRLCAVVEDLRGIPIIVLGDLVLDEFAYGEIARVSREAPVLILDYKESRYALGGGANAAANLTALGAQVRVVGRLGKDHAGEALLGLFEERGIDRRGIVRDPAYQTPVKTRILAGGAHTSKQQIVRLDRGRMGQPLPREIAGTLLARFAKFAKNAAALLVADYGFGAASPKLRHAARPAAPDVVTLDSRFRVLEFPGVTAATPNVAEVEQALGMQIPDARTDALADAGVSLLRKLKAEAIVITQGSRGMTLFEKRRAPVHFPPFGTDEVADVTGAGDTVISTFTLALAGGESFASATELANIAGGLVVMKRGTATVATQELIRALREGPPAGVRQA